MAKRNKMITIGRNLLTGLYLFSGSMHMIKPQVFNNIVPPKLPGSPSVYTYLSGLAEIVTAILMSRPKTRRSGGMVSFILLLAVWPANFQMYLQNQNSSLLKQAILLMRLPLQIPMLYLSYSLAQGDNLDK